MPTWVYGDILCFTTHTWIYGDILCFETHEVAYPTVALSRVTSLIHRWRPGLYTLQIGIGDITSDFTMPDIIRAQPREVTPVPPEPPPEPPGPDECPEDGIYTCKGYDLYQCQFGRWVLKETNSPRCGAPTEECPEGMYNCQGYDLYQCQFGGWVLKETNSPRCGYRG